MSDITVNVTNAGAANVSVSSGSTVNATVGNGGAVNVALGTISPGNATVVSGTLAINSTTTLAAGSQAYVVNNGTSYAASLDIGIPAGPATTVLVGSTTTLESGNATVAGTTSGSNLTLAFAIPRGAAGINGTDGITPFFSIGNVSTLSAGSNATVTATTSNGGANVALAFGIPAGAAGSSGSNLTLSDATPSNLGTASAGSSNSASRADHTHNLPAIAYANLSGVPSNFPTNTTLVSGLADGYATVGHAHNYVTSLNNLTGNLTLAAGSNVTLSVANSTLTISSSGGGLDANAAVDGGDFIGEQFSGITITSQPQSQSGAMTFGSWSNVTAVSSSIVSLGFAAHLAGKFYVGGLDGVLRSSSNLSSWTTESTSSSGSLLRGGASNGTRTIVVGQIVNDGTAWKNAWYTDDGSSWTSTKSGGDSASLARVAFGAGRFVAIEHSSNAFVYGGPSPVPSNILAYTSSDGASWTERNLSANFSSCIGLAYGGGVFVAVFSYANVTGYEYTLYSTSTDGITWTNRTLPWGLYYSLPRIAYGNGVFVLVAGSKGVGSNVAWTSTDGINWTSRTLPLAANWSSVAYSAGRFVLLSSTTGTDIVTSTNGINWTLGDLGVSGSWAGSAGSADTVVVVPSDISNAGRKASATTATASFSTTATATGTAGTISYQWQVSLDGGSTWSNVSGATSSTLSLTGLTTADSGKRYRVAVSAVGATTVYSQTAVLTVTG